LKKLIKKIKDCTDSRCLWRVDDIRRYVIFHPKVLKLKWRFFKVVRGTRNCCGIHLCFHCWH